MREESFNTSALLHRIAKTSDFNEFVSNFEGVMRETPFSEYLAGLCEEKHLVPGHIIRTAQIDRTYGHQLFNGTRKPSRDKVIQLAFGFGMTVDEAQRLLQAAGKSPLYPKIMRDAAFIFLPVEGQWTY